MIWKNPSSAAGHVFFNLFVFEAVSMLATLPHELGHAWAGRQLGFDVRKVLVGFGATVFIGKILGFDVEFKRIPFGGITIGFPVGSHWVRTRHFLFVLAGPLANFMLAACAYWLVPSDSKTFNFERPLNFWWLFVLGNLFLVIFSLIPFVALTAYGRLPSDGLALFQLAILRRLPFVPKHGPAKFLSFEYNARRVIKSTAAIFLSLCGLLCLSLALLMVKDLLFKHADAGLWFAASVLAGLGAAFAWSVSRVFRTPTASWSLNPYAGPSPHSQIVDAYQSDLERRSHWPEDLLKEPLGLELNRLKEEKKLDEAEKLLAEALQKAPQNLTLLMNRAEVLGLAARWRDVEMVLASALLQTDLNPATRTILLAEQIKAVLKQDDFERARNMVQSFLDRPPPLPEKLYLLDYLACLPFMDGLPGCLSDADRWSAQALELQPENLSLKGTRGSILIEQGKFAEGELLLDEVYAKSEADIDKGIASLFLALAQKHRGDVTAAIRWGKRAKRIYPVPWLLQRIESEFGKVV